jgi:rsbT co-antagonist protein RsbR
MTSQDYAGEPDMTALQQRITELEELLITSQREALELRRFFDMSLDMLCIAGFDGYFKRLNPAWQQTLGFTNEELCAEPFVNFVHPDDRQETLAVAEQVITGNQVVNFENRYRCKDGTYKWIEWRAVAFPEQHIIYAVARDVTETRQIQEQLRQANTRLEQQIMQQTAELRQNQRLLREVLDNAPSPIFVKDTEGRVILANQQIEIFLNIEPGTIIGKTAYDLTPPDVAEAVWESERQTLITGQPVEVEEHIPQQDGIHTVMAVKFPIYNEEGEAYAVGGILTDITEHKRLEEQRVALQEQIIESQKTALRELSTPLMPISDGVVVMPLVGSIDSSRAQQIMEMLLIGVADNQAEIALLDITGVPVIDTQVANAIIQTAHAVRLLGAQVILTGIGPSMAQTLVQLGADLDDIITLSTLQRGIAYALDQANGQT